jgi:hypothetical protein
MDVVSFCIVSAPQYLSAIAYTPVGSTAPLVLAWNRVPKLRWTPPHQPFGYEWLMPG